MAGCTDRRSPHGGKLLPQRHRFMKPIGLFGVEPRTVRRAATFLRTGQAILAEPRRMLWETGQGRVSDPRTRPVALRPGVSRLVRKVPDAVAVPLALDNPVWTEKRPEAVARFAPPLPAEEAATGDRLEAALTRDRGLARRRCRAARSGPVRDHSARDGRRRRRRRPLAARRRTAPRKALRRRAPGGRLTRCLGRAPGFRRAAGSPGGCSISPRAPARGPDQRSTAGSTPVTLAPVGLATCPAVRGSGAPATSGAGRPCREARVAGRDPRGGNPPEGMADRCSRPLARRLRLSTR